MLRLMLVAFALCGLDIADAAPNGALSRGSDQTFFVEVRGPVNKAPLKEHYRPYQDSLRPYYGDKPGPALSAPKEDSRPYQDSLHPSIEDSLWWHYKKDTNVYDDKPRSALPVEPDPPIEINREKQDDDRPPDDRPRPGCQDGLDGIGRPC
jgi:hypothetical protein